MGLDPGSSRAGAGGTAKSGPTWPPPPLPLALADSEVHVWRADLDAAAAREEALRHLMGEEERARAARFAFERDRQRFVAAHGVLRTILARYLGVAPRGLRFSTGQWGKPALLREQADEDLRFNLSHSDGLALLAVTRGREVGIDVERIRSDQDHEQIAAQFFSAREAAAIRELPQAERVEAFFLCWTRKEAFVKATGKGLTVPLDELDVSVAPGEPAALVSTRFDAAEASRWSLAALTVGEGYAAALAVEGHGWRLRRWQWPLEWAGGAGRSDQ